MTLPRLTSALRAFASVTAGDDAEIHGHHASDIVEKRRQTAVQQAEAGFNWQKLIDSVQKESTLSQKEAKMALRELIQVTRDMSTLYSILIY